MPLPKQTIPMPFVQGQDTRTDPKQLPAPKLLLLQDADFESPGQLVQPNGSIALVRDKIGGGSISSSDAPNSIYSLVTQLMMRGKEQIFSYSTVSSKWKATATPAPLAYSKQTLFAGNFNSYEAGYAENSTYSVYAILVENGISGVSTKVPILLVRVVEKSTGILRYEAIINFTAGEMPPKCIISGATAVVFYGSGPNITASHIDLTTMTATNHVVGGGSAFTVTEGSFAPMSWRTTFDEVAAFFKNSNGDFYAAVYSIVSGAWLVSPTGPIAGMVYSPYVAVQQGANSAADRVYLFFGDGDGSSTGRPKVQVRDASLTTIATANLSTINPDPNANWNFSAAAVGSSMTVYFSATEAVQAVPPNTFIRVASITSAGVVAAVSTKFTTATAQPVIEPFTFLGKNYAIANRSLYQRLTMISEASGVSTAGIMPEANFGIGDHTAIDRSLYSTSTLFAFAAVETIRSLGDGSNESRLVRYLFEYSQLNLGSSIQLGNTLYFPGAQPLCFDGLTLAEAGFDESPKMTPSPNGAGNNTLGTHLYTAVAEWYDSNGNLQRSVPSAPVSRTITAGVDQDLYWLLTMGTTGKSPNFIIALYKTVKDGSVFYRVGATGAISNGVVVGGSVHDSISDTLLVANEQLYTTGGVLEDAPWPASSYIHVHGTRPLLVSSEDPNKVFIGKAIAEKTAPQFNEDIFMRFDKGVGGVLALASLDEKLVAFKERTKFFVVGDGPNDLGVNMTYSDPEEIQTDTGLSEVRSIVSFSGGIIYKSVRGWYLLDRKLQEQFIGSEVNRFNSKTVSGTLKVASRNQVRIFHTDGTTLIYDYVTGQWATRTNQAAQGVCLWNGVTTYVDSNAFVYYQNPSQWLEGSALVEPKFTTAWIATAQVQGFQRIYSAIVFGELRARHTLRIRVGFDYDPNWKDEFTIDSNTAAVTTALNNDSYYQSVVSSGGQPDKMLQYRIRPYIQKCESIRFEITILNSQSANSELARISGIALEVGVKPGTKRLEAGRIIS